MVEVGHDEPLRWAEAGQDVEQGQRVGATGDANDQRATGGCQAGRRQRPVQRRPHLDDQLVHRLQLAQRVEGVLLRKRGDAG